VGIVLIIGAIQGFALSFLIYQKGRTLFANRFLWSLMFIFSIMLAVMWLSDIGFYLTYPKIMYTFEGIQFILFPLYFLYSKYLTNKHKKFDRKDWLHFLPFIIYKLLLIPFYFMNMEEISSFQNSIIISSYPLQYIIFNWVLIFQGSIYMILTIRKVNERNQFLDEHFSSNYRIKLDWLKNASYLGVLTTLVFTIENILLITSNSISDLFGISSIAAGIYIYAIGYLGFSHSGVFTELIVIENKELEKEHITNGKYEKSGLSKEKADEYYQKLIQLMEGKKPYKQNKLTLGELAELISVSSHNLSEIINTKTKMNFFDFINQYRIEEVKKEILKPKNDSFTILAIAINAGFNSKSSFNTLFKEYEKMTPTQYRNEFLKLNQ
jgi:AraC-like DNA-binding protein